jgi:mannose-6-phosphate isomerase
MIPSAPLCFNLWLRPMPWGGTRLCDLFNGTMSDNPIGEAWLLSDHPLHQSLWNDDEHTTLHELLSDDTLAAQRSTPLNCFPLLIKLLDAQQNLSIQVHPDDELASRWSPGEGGKTEAWIVLDAAPDSAIYLGLKPGIDKATFARELASGNAPLCLNRYQPRIGETYFVPAGTVHALGQGVMVLEVQQTSDATFRLYDWGRLGADGKPRDLHLEAGLACTVVAPEGAGLQKPRRDSDGAETLVQSPFFTIRRWQSPGQVTIQSPAIVIPWANDARFPSSGETLKQGHACLIPSAMSKAAFETTPDTILFEIRWPAKD